PVHLVRRAVRPLLAAARRFAFQPGPFLLELRSAAWVGLELVERRSALGRRTASASTCFRACRRCRRLPPASGLPALASTSRTWPRSMPVVESDATRALTTLRRLDSADFS